jgi:hypothetical protein
MCRVYSTPLFDMATDCIIVCPSLLVIVDRKQFSNERVVV